MATQSDNTNTGVVATIVVVGSFAMIAVSALLYAMVRSEEAEVDAVRPMHADLDTIASVERQQEAALNAPAHWVEKEKGKVGLPISRAMKLVIDEYRQDPAKASPPIPPGLVLPPMPGTGGAGAGGASSLAAVPGTAGAPGATPGGALVPGSVPAPKGAPGATPVIDALVGGAPGEPATNNPAGPRAVSPGPQAPVAAPNTPALPAPAGAKPPAAPSGAPPAPRTGPSTGGASATGAAPSTPAPAQPVPAQPAAPATGN